MKKSLVALAALAATGAFAQSTATVSGNLTFGVGTTEFGTAKSGAQIVRQTGNIAFKGTEDLGNGLKANFELQTTIGQAAATNVSTTPSSSTATNQNVAQRTLLGDRGAYVNLQGGFGTAQVGRAATAVRALWGAIGDVSRLGVVNGISASSSGQSFSEDGNLAIAAGDANARVIYGDTYANQVSYVSPSFSGFTVAVGMLPVQSSSTGVGNDATNKDTYSYSLQYATGPIAAAYNLTDAKGGSAPYKLHTILASYDFGVAKVGLTHQAVKLATGTNPGNGTALTATVPVGPGSFGLGWGKRGSATQTGTSFGDDVKQVFAGYRYDLSKRTNLQVVYNKIDRNNSTGAKTTDLKETHLIVAHTF